MKTISIEIISLLGLTTAVSGINFCLDNLCDGHLHIGCQNSGAISLLCPLIGTEMVKMTDALKAKIIESHNEKRNTIADGKLPGFKPAVRMATMRWDDDLALTAWYNVKTCKFAHDLCHNTDAYRYSGQNLAKMWWTKWTYTDEEIILSQIDDWWEEHVDAEMAELENYPIETKNLIGHFSVMTADKNVAVGCAAIRFPENGWNSFTLACNYATTNVVGRPLYLTGGTCSKCNSGRNSKYPALCSASEIYNVNVL